MEHARLGKPLDRQRVNAGPREPMLLAATSESPLPESSDSFPKDTQTIEISRHRVVVESSLARSTGATRAYAPPGGAYASEVAA